MNHFLALRLTDECRDRLAEVCRRLQEWQLPASWVHPEDLHLTVLFLGRLDADEQRTLPYAIDQLASTIARPTLHLSGLGAVGGRSEPRVVYCAARDQEGAVHRTHADLCDAIGVRPERTFLPHITLCRPKTPERWAPAPRRDWPQLLEAHGLADWGECATTDLVLYQSTGATPRYRMLASWPLLRAA